jgi:hypothetical protein
VIPLVADRADDGGRTRNGQVALEAEMQSRSSRGRTPVENSVQQSWVVIESAAPDIGSEARRTRSVHEGT